jgi:hypothetical protein
MQTIGVDLHTRQQTVAMLNVETGEVVEKTLRTKAIWCGSSIRLLLARLAWESKPPVRCSGSSSCKPSNRRIARTIRHSDHSS